MNDFYDDVIELKTDYNKDFICNIVSDVFNTVEYNDICEIVENKIFLPSSNNAIPGRVNLRLTPFWRKPLNRLDPKDHTNKQVIMASVQSTKTSVLINGMLALYYIAPANTMFMFPREKDAQTFSTDRLMPIVEASPELKDDFKLKNRDTDNKLLKKKIKSSDLYLVNANSAQSAKSVPCKYLFSTESAEYPLDVAGQGSPIKLLEGRKTSFGDYYKEMIESTVTDKKSIIYQEWFAGSRSYYYFPCPYCQQLIKFEFNQLQYIIDTNNKTRCIPNSVFYKCQKCNNTFDESCKLEILNDERADWIDSNEYASYYSYHLNMLYIPFQKWNNVIDAYLEALDDDRKMKTFLNNYLAEPFEEEVLELDYAILHNKAKESEYALLQIPCEVVYLTASVDTQDDRLAIDIKGWGEDEECFTIYYNEIDGNTAEDKVWEDMKEIVLQDFLHPSGKIINVKVCAIDVGGHRTDKARLFCMNNREIFKAIMGDRNPNKSDIVTTVKKKQVYIPSTKSYIGVINQYYIGTSYVKEILYHRLKDEKESGARVIHFNRDLNEQYFKMLTNEKCIYKYNKNNNLVQRWEKKHNNARNESFDTFVYNYAIAYHLLNIHLLSGQRYKKLYKSLYGDYVFNENEEKDSVNNVVKQEIKDDKILVKKPVRKIVKKFFRNSF